jgi:uncharacterized protein
MNSSSFLRPFVRNLVGGGGLFYSARLFLFALLLLLQVVKGAFGLEVPRCEGYVNDHAELISAGMEKSLEEVLTNFYRTDSIQLVVLTIDTLEGTSLDEFALKVSDHWNIGQSNRQSEKKKGVGKGVLLLVAKEERGIRIEVNYGLEGILTNLTAGHIIDAMIIPHFQLGHFDQGIESGVHGIIQTTKGIIVEASSSPAINNKDSQNWTAVVLLVVLFLFFGSIFKVFRYLRERAQKREKKRHWSEEVHRQQDEQRKKKEWEESEKERRDWQGGKSGSQEEDKGPTVKEDKYYREILGLPGQVTLEEVKICYRKLAAQYHPDKVNHLGPKLKEIAEQEMIKLNEAYEYFKKYLVD